MGCCIALALIIGSVRLAWFRLVRGETPRRTGFAPPARRLGPGAAPTMTASTGVSRPIAEPATRRWRPARRASSGLVLALAALFGFGLYCAALALLTRTGLVHAMGRGMSWQRRDLVLIGGAVAATVVALILRVHRADPAERARHVGFALVGAGGAWSLLSVLDMHMAGMVAHHTDVLADLAMHGPGFAAVVIGAGLLVTGERRLNSLSPNTTRGT